MIYERTHLFSTDIQLQPLWITIPAGNVKIIATDPNPWPNEGITGYIPAGTSQIFDVGTFEIAKYPITNGQYGKFIVAGGYDQRQWWTDEGWQAKEQNHWVVPLNWHAPRWKTNHPIVGVSWYEAVAFCQWLSHLTGEKISLPTEQQWQRAAQDDAVDEVRGNRYSFTGTTEVTRYEGKEESLFGVVDMMSNAWEWCLTLYESGSSNLDVTGNRITKGGSWMLIYSRALNMWNTDRMGLSPVFQLGYVGFRCVRS